MIKLKDLLKESVDKTKLKKVYNNLNKGDEVTIKYGSSIRSGSSVTLIVTKGKTTVGKAKVERITLVNKEKPKSVKYYLYNRNGNISLAIGDMGATIDDIEMNESVNEVASRTAMEIAALTGTNKNFVQDFVDKHELNIEKVFQYVKKGKFPQRMEFVSAVAGKDGNPIQKKLIKMFKESVNEGNRTYFRAAYEAAEYAREMAEKKGFEIDEDDWQTQIALGGKYNRLRPGVGKTHSFSVGLIKNGKPQRKELQISLYGMDSGNYELTTYIN